MILLDTKNNLIATKLIFKGTLNNITIHPREIFKFVIENSASKFIMAHNHPSQNKIASKEDIEVTKRIYFISEILGIELIDHVIITEKTWYSIFENNQIR